MRLTPRERDYLNPFTNERRRFTSGNCCITRIVAYDVPADIADRVIAKQVLIYCGKPLVFCCQDDGRRQTAQEDVC